MINYKKIITWMLLILATIDVILTLYIIKTGLGYEVNIIPALFLNNPNLPAIIVYPLFLAVKYATILMLYYYVIKFEEINKFIVYFFLLFVLIIYLFVILHSLSIIFLTKNIITI